MKKAAEEGKDQSSSFDVGNGTAQGDDSIGPEKQSSAGDVTTFTSSELPVPKSMANRNKKRGFMKEMNNVQGTKTVFGSDAQASSTPIADVPIKDANDSTTYLTPQLTGPSTTTRRVLPPSEMDLPNNVFVTHQVYDRRGWTPRGRAARHRAEALVQEEQDEEEEEQEMEMDVDEEEEVIRGDPVSTGPSGLLNGAVDIFSPAKGYNDEDGMWTKAEERFDELLTVNRHSKPAKESVIAWKVRQAFLYPTTRKVC